MFSKRKSENPSVDSATYLLLSLIVPVQNMIFNFCYDFATLPPKFSTLGSGWEAMAII